MYRSPWFRLWVDVVAFRIERWQHDVLRWGCPVVPKTDDWPGDAKTAIRLVDTGALLRATLALWVVLRLSWLYHRALDLASLGI